jgi:hypothetical protein
MDPSTASRASENPPELEEMPAAVRRALDEVHAAVEALHRDQMAAIADLAFERAADLRERADALKRRKEQVMREWQQTKAARTAEPDAAADGRRDPGS